MMDTTDEIKQAAERRLKDIDEEITPLITQVTALQTEQRALRRLLLAYKPPKDGDVVVTTA